MSEQLWTGREPAARSVAARAWHGLGWIGGATRRHAGFALLVAGVGFGVVREAIRPSTWRRTVRAEFGRALHQAVRGGFAATLVAAALAGLVMVSQALYWLGAAGQEELIGPVLVTVLVREVAPFLVGMILLGRSGVVAMAELGALQASGGVRAVEAQGLDPFQLLVLPRVCAIAVASYTLGVTFVLGALASGFVAGSLLGKVEMSVWNFLGRVLQAMNPGDFVMFPGKMIAIGLLVGLTACLTALTAGPRDEAAQVLPRGYVRGVLAILLASVVLSLAI